LPIARSVFPCLQHNPRYYLESISLLEATGHPGPAIATPLINLATVRTEQGRLGEAEELHTRALNLLARVFGPAAAEVGVALNGLAELSIKRRNHSEAERHLLRALPLWDGVNQAGKHRAMTLFHLSTVRDRQGRAAEAESLLRRAVSDWEDSVGEAHPTYAAAITRLAMLLAGTKPHEAEGLFAVALSFREKQLGADHPETGRTLAAYAHLLRRSGRKREARALQERADRIARNSPPDLSSYTVNISVLGLEKQN
jgi:tetratricopeptide (TPR) repeat protein